MTFELPTYKKNPDYKQRMFEICDCKVTQDENGKFYLSGYANTKNKPDSYGDIPTNFNGQPVYDLSRFNKNPGMFMNHNTNVECTMGIFTELKEDEIGLWFKCLLQNLDDCFYPKLKQAVRNYMTGFSRALSIGGFWYYDDPKNKSHLTRAYIYEISGVGVGADEDALCHSNMPKNFDKGSTKQIQVNDLKESGLIKDALSSLITTYNRR